MFFKTLNIQHLFKKKNTPNRNPSIEFFSLWRVSLSYECFTSAWVLSLLIWKKCNKESLLKICQVLHHGNSDNKMSAVLGSGEGNKTQSAWASSLLQLNTGILKVIIETFKALLTNEKLEIYSLNILKCQEQIHLLLRGLFFEV